MLVKHSEDKQLRADAMQRMYESVSATLEPSSCVQVGNTDDFSLQIDSQMVEDTPPILQSPIWFQEKGNGIRLPVYVSYSPPFIIYMVIPWILPSQN